MSFSEYLQVVNGFLESVPVNADVLKLDKELRSRTNRVHSAHIVFSFSSSSHVFACRHNIMAFTLIGRVNIGYLGI